MFSGHNRTDLRMKPFSTDKKAIYTCANQDLIVKLT